MEKERIENFLGGLILALALIGLVLIVREAFSDEQKPYTVEWKCGDSKGVMDITRNTTINCNLITR